MKKILALVLSIVLVFSMAACGGETTAPEGQGSTDNTESQTSENTESNNGELTFMGVKTEPAKKAEARFSDLVVESSAGTLQVKSLTDETEISDSDKLEKVISGECDIAVGTCDAFTETLGDLYLFDMFGLFGSKDEVKAFLGGEAVNTLKASLEESGLELLGIWDKGFNQILLSEMPIRMPDDLQGLRIGTGISEDALKLWSKTGADPSHAEGSDVLINLEEWAIDAYDGSVETMASLEAQNAGAYLVETAHSYTPYICVMNLEKFNSMTDVQKSAILDSMREVQMNSFSESDAYESYLLSEFQKAGIEVIQLTDEEKTAFNEVLVTESAEKTIKKLMPHPEILDAAKEELKVLRESQVADAQ